MSAPTVTRAITDTVSVTAGSLAAYRAAVRAMITGAPGADPASPVHAFVLCHGPAQRFIAGLAAASSEPPSVVHLAQEIRLRRPVPAAEPITVGIDLLAARREARGTRLVLRSTLAGGTGAPLSELATTVLLVGADAPEPFGDLPPAPAPKPGPGAGERVSVTHHLTTAMISRYAEVSGDHNPIHLDPEAAGRAGFPGVIAHGMSVLALACEEAIDRYAGGDPARVRGIGGRFSAPVLPGEPVEFGFQPDGEVIGFTVKSPRGVAVKAGFVELAAEGDFEGPAVREPGADFREPAVEGGASHA
ncbi:MaoC/PaaZ C-terminal domain-containing protein [Nonomuraea sp. B12E4]|uniref:MaoC/PaaZ C-terminal domain-containing protein n=1 Tax=Nonomuraea sp. B12E4 TaxID=3153564 RepID=UPI00325D7858